MPQKLPRKFYHRDDTIQIARDLLGKLLVVPDDSGSRISGMIVETEAYLGIGDRAAHSHAGRRTPRNEVMYSRGGQVYIFFIYGLYYQFNIVTGPVDHPHAVLIRAVEPIEGIETMRERRSVPRAIASGALPANMADKNLTSGPGKLCIALGIDRSLNNQHISGDRVWLERHETPIDSRIAVGKRIGIDYAGEDAGKPWRFWIRDNPFVSKPRLEISAKT